MNTSTGTTLEQYTEWLTREVQRKRFGKVTLTLIVTDGQITDAEKWSMDHDHFQLQPRVP